MKVRASPRHDKLEAGHFFNLANLNDNLNAGRREVDAKHNVIVPKAVR